HPPTSDCKDQPSEAANAEKKICAYTTKVNKTSCDYMQRSALDLLKEMDSHFGRECPRFFSAIEPDSFYYEEYKRTFRPMFSRSYGPQCGYDDSVAIMPTQLFAYASDPVLLQNMGGDDASQSICLAKDLSLVDCKGPEAVQWVHIFGFGDDDIGGEIFYNEYGSGETKDYRMRCISRSSDPADKTLSIVVCDASHASNTRWDYDGNNGILKVPQSDNNECIVVNTSLKKVEVGDCSSSLARWSQYSECKLNSRTNTLPMKLELIDHPGKCMVPTSSSTPSSGIQLGESRYTSDTTKEPENLPNGLMECSGTENAVFYRNVLAGEKDNIFQWSKMTSGKPDGPLYCVEIGGSGPQKECGDLTQEQQWKKHDQVVDITAISIKPGLLQNKITDPEVLLRAKANAIRRMASRINPVVTSTLTVGNQALDLIETVGTSSEDLVSLCQVNTNMMSIIASYRPAISTVNVIKVFQPLPYVGPVIKATKLPTIMKQIANRLKSGSNKLVKVGRKFDKVISPFGRFLSIVERIVTTLVVSMQRLDGFVEFITRLIYCAYEKGTNKDYPLDVQKKFRGFVDRVNGWVKALLTAVGTATQWLKTLKDNLSVLNEFKVDDIKAFAKTLNTNKLSEIVAWVCFDGKACAGLETIGDFLGEIENLIRSIPLAGELWDTVSSLVSSILEDLFAFFGSFLPSFDIDVPFVEEIKEEVFEAKDEITEALGNFADIIEVDEVMEFVSNGVEVIKDAIPPALRDIDCTEPDIGCIIEKLGSVFNFDVDLASRPPQLQIGDDTLSPDFDLLNAGLAELAGFQQDVTALFDSGVECNEYETVKIDYIKLLRQCKKDQSG
ncbi:hypothetical protein THAOC_01618, partial [Thalassiosira oceanica]